MSIGTWNKEDSPSKSEESAGPQSLQEAIDTGALRVVNGKLVFDGDICCANATSFGYKPTHIAAE